MLPKLQYHVEPEKGWLNDPNGLCYFNGKYHAFFQHYPNATVWTAPLYWAHVTSDDLIHWEEQPMGLTPDQPYESTGGCFSGSAFIKDGKAYFFYTAVGDGNVQTQCLATSEDGITLKKYEGNPIIDERPVDPTGRDFRDPKVFEWTDGTYRMVCGTGHEGYAAVLLYKSSDLYNWEYVGPIFETREMGPVLECPDLYPLEDKWVLCFSRMDQPQTVQYVVGTFDGEHFTAESVQKPEIGPNYYAPQSFEDEKGRRIVMAWMTPWGQPEDTDGVRCGCLTLPRVASLKNGKLCFEPVEEAASLLVEEDPHVKKGPWLFQVTDGKKILLERPACEVKDVKIFTDTHTCEVFINGGEQVVSFYFQP